jgi:hypothetical protein
MSMIQRRPTSEQDHSTVVISQIPFFLVGFQRSGTTMLRLMLNAHPELAVPHDSARLWFNYRDKAGSYKNSPADAMRMIDDLLCEPRIKAWKTELPREQIFADPLPVTFPEIMRRFHEVYARAQGKRMWGDKNTGTLTELDQLDRMFPACKVIHLVRDGRDCALSHLSKEYVYGYANVLRVALEWREQVTLCRKMGAMLPADRYMEIRYEDLLASPERELRKICHFLGVGYAAEMLTYYRTVSSNVPDDRRGLWPLLDQPPQAANVNKWKTKMSGADRAIFQRHAGALLTHYGYEALPNSMTNVGRWRELWLHIHERIAWRFKQNG